MTKFTVYSRNGCHLCEVLIEELLPLVRDRAEIEVIDIDTAAELREKYNIRVPVLVFDGQELCEYRLDQEAVKAALQ